jgi:hypothetical protein
LRGRHLIVLSCGNAATGTTDRLEQSGKANPRGYPHSAKVSEGNRAKTTKQLALEIRQLPAGMNKARLSYPIVLDPDKNVHKQYTIEGLPRSFVYDRDGKLVAQAIDMRTKKQFLEMLEKAGLRTMRVRPATDGVKTAAGTLAPGRASFF